MNRHQRRATVKAHGETWRKHRASVQFVQQAREMERRGLKVTPEQAREALGRFAAAGGQIPLGEVLRDEQAAQTDLASLRKMTVSTN